MEAPQLAVVMMDGGRYQRRDHFGQEDSLEENTRHKHWRESKVGCLLSMKSVTHSSDPARERFDRLALDFLRRLVVIQCENAVRVD